MVETPVPQNESGGSLPRSFEDLCSRLGCSFSAEQMRLRCGNNKTTQQGTKPKEDQETEHAEFVRLFRGSLLYCAERDPKFYERCRSQRAAR